MHDKYPEIGANAPKQENHQHRLLAAVSAVRRSATLAQDVLYALAGNPRELVGGNTKAETAGYPPLAAVLTSAPEDIQVACEKLDATLREIRSTLRL